MTTQELLQELQNLDVTYRCDEGELCIDAPEDALTPELIAALENQTEDILALLSETSSPANETPQDIPASSPLLQQDALTAVVRLENEVLPAIATMEVHAALVDQTRVSAVRSLLSIGKSFVTQSIRKRKRASCVRSCPLWQTISSGIMKIQKSPKFSRRGSVEMMKQRGRCEDVSTQLQKQWCLQQSDDNKLLEKQCVCQISGQKSASGADDAALEVGTLLSDGRYGIVRILYQRPRLNLYLGRRISSSYLVAEVAEGFEPLFAIRELVLTGLSLERQSCIIAAAFEEFVSPVVPGSPRLPAGRDRVWVEGERHYFAVQLHGTKGDGHDRAVMLDELLLTCKEWPVWLHKKVALRWGIQLCRIVARLHHLHIVLGILDPATILVDNVGQATWAPVLLPIWPPMPHYWSLATSPPTPQALCRLIFPVARTLHNNAFAAPETLRRICDERSDIYALGAVLYLLLTGYAPVAATHRLDAVRSLRLERIAASVSLQGPGRETERLGPQLAGEVGDGLELIPPHLLRSSLLPELELIVLRALALDPMQRYASVFALVEALEAVEERYAKESAEKIASKKALLRMLKW